MGYVLMRKISGFTLIEMIIVIVITAIVGGMVSIFIAHSIDGYMDSVRRAEMTDAADTALRRISRDVRTALPNSLRSTGSASNQCFEFLPTVGGGRYRLQLSGTGTGDPLLFSQADDGFDVLASDNISTLFPGSAAYYAVIYNTGQSGADAYDPTSLNRAPIKNTSTASHIDLSAPNQFPFESPGKRFHVIPDYSVVYSCSGGNLVRSTRAISATPLSACPSTGAVLLDNIDCAASSFSYIPVVSQRYGLLAINLVVTRSGESVRLYDEVHINNVP